MGDAHGWSYKAQYTLPMVMGRVDGPCSRVVWTIARGSTRPVNRVACTDPNKRATAHR